MIQKTSSCALSGSYLNATGKIPFTFTNDYMFRVVPQKRPNVLKGLLSSMLHLAPEDIVSIVIENPIMLGESVKDKGFVLDIKVTLNNKIVIDLEMQVINEANWPVRSLSYLCRNFDNLHRGDKYLDTKPAIHIGFLDFQPFDDNLEFNATYKLLNVKNQHLYSDNFTLNVVDLTHINLATDEDKAFRIDHWARLFKATTWEEIKMIAENNEYMSEALQTLYECNEDELIREQCLAREAEIGLKNYYKRSIKERDEKLAEQDVLLAEKDTLLIEKDNLLTEKDAEIARLRAQLAAQKKA